MKKIFIYIVFASVLLSACGTFFETEFKDIFTIRNETEHTITIYAYDNQAVTLDTSYFHNPIEVDIFEIPPLQSISESSESIGGGTIAFMANSRIDSVSIIFDKTKIIQYSCYEPGFACFDKRNVLNISYYNMQCSSETTCEYIYSITEEDYENAEFIGQ